MDPTYHRPERHSFLKTALPASASPVTSASTPYLWMTVSFPSFSLNSSLPTAVGVGACLRVSLEKFRKAREAMGEQGSRIGEDQRELAKECESQAAGQPAGS